MGTLRGWVFDDWGYFPILPSLSIKVNILIDETRHARLADFGLLTIISDPRYLLSSSSHSHGGTLRWMSPERIAPERFGLEKSRPTISSDCYALGMVIYETISGNLPFYKDTDLTVFMKVVMEDKRPPREARFTESLWKMLEMCWIPKPKDRPSIDDVLQCLKVVRNPPEPPSPGLDEETEGDDNDRDPATEGDGNDWDSATGGDGNDWDSATEGDGSDQDSATDSSGKFQRNPRVMLRC